MKELTQAKELLLCHRCCGDGFGLIKNWVKANPGVEYKVKKVGIFSCKPLAEQYGFDVNKDLPLLIVDGIVIKKEVKVKNVVTKPIINMETK